MPDFLAFTDGGTPIGHCLNREVHNRKNRRHHEHRVTHTTLLCLASIDINGGIYGDTSNENKAS